MNSVRTVDPVSRAVVQNRLISVVRDMSTTLRRAAYSPIITEVKDFSSVLLRPDGSMVAQAEGIPSFLGSMSPLLPPVVERYPLATMETGDVFVSNDPFTANGTHKNDVNILRPIFWDGVPVLFSATKAHWTDIGAKDPGSWSPDATNTFQEGVSIPPLRLVHAGRTNDELMEMILAGTRLRESNAGDLMAQISACLVGQQRVHELLEQYGWDHVDACISSLYDDIEARVRAAIEAVPDGTYTGRDMVDSDGVSDDPIEVVVHVTIAGSDIDFDFRDCPDQRVGASGNAYLVNTIASCRVAMKCLFGADLETNDGFYRPMTVQTRPGSVTHPLPPAPGTTWDNMGRAIYESVLFALAPVMPERVTAGIFGGVQAMAIAGRDAADRDYIHFMPYAGGWGARHHRDGMNAVCTWENGDNDNVPCEVVETNFPLLVERYELIEDSGGPGRMRGGLGVRTDFRVLSDAASVSAGLFRWRFAPPGLFGGGEGARNHLVLDADGASPSDQPLAAGVEVGHRNLISHRTGGGGGFGDPRDRDREALIRDIEDGYVSRASATEHYGLNDDLPTGEH